jgi:RNA polymerase sigma-70 factor (ECF subfamily)
MSDVSERESLGEAWELARKEFPELAVPLEIYESIAAKLPPEYPSHLRPGDLYLLCGCQLADPFALREFKRIFLDQVRRALRDFAMDEAMAEDIEQVVWTKFMVGEAGELLPIFRYAGKGKLKSFLRVAAVRTAMTWFRQQNKLLPLQTDDRTESSAATDLPLLLAKARHREQFRRAFRAAMAKLEPTQRQLLRRHYVDGISSDDLATELNVHRATVHRWLIAAREALYSHTKTEMLAEEAMSPAEFQSVARLLAGSLEVSLNRLL